MPEHKTRNTFHSNLRSKQSLLMKFVILQKKKFSPKISTKTAMSKLVPGPFVVTKN